MTAVIPAVLGWKNPGDDGAQLRLYALDAGNAPRWSKDSETGRTLELAAQVDGDEGHRYLLIHVGDRYVDQAAVDAFAEHVEQIHAETFGDQPTTFWARLMGYTPVRPFAAEGARVALMSCLDCGAALILDPGDDANQINVLELHDSWHERLASLLPFQS